MLSGRYFNPDDYLETDAGRVFTPERSRAAFQRAYSDLRQALRSAQSGAQLFVVVGVQGGGKTTWIRENAGSLGPRAHFFDAALPRAIHRSPVVAIARDCGVPACAVWVHVSLEVALARNQLRRADHRVPDAAIRNVHSIMEPPSTGEGFAEVSKVQA